MADKIKVALDSSTVINLFMLVHPKNDKDGKVLEALKNKSLTFEDWRTTPKEELPRLLIDKFLGRRTGGVYLNLMDIYNILTWVTSGEIEVYITPTTLHELDDLNELEEEFLRNYIKVVTINPEQEDMIYTHIDALAREYVKFGAIRDEYIPELRRKSPSRDAYIMAEASICGLSLITCDWKDLINTDLYTKDYTKANLIKQINREFKGINLCVKSLTNQKMTTTAVQFDRFVKDIKQNRIWLYSGGSSVNINEENEMIIR